MNSTAQPAAKAQNQKLSEYIAGSDIMVDLISKIRQDFRIRDILSTVLIRVEDKTVVSLANTMLLSAGESTDTSVEPCDYEKWREAEALTLSNEYDSRRFNRSTKIETLCMKVRDHEQYSFIVRIKSESISDRVVKYTFVKLTPDAKFIVGTRQEITKSLEHDIVTGGLNREGLLREMEVKYKSAKESKTKLSVLCFNIKNFRVINELYGNGVGDSVLQHMYTSIVVSELHPLSYSRYESDNFICLVRRELVDTDVVSRLCLQEFLNGDLKVRYHCKCGIYHVEDLDREPVHACDHAKLAISFIKEQYLTPWMVYEHKMQKSFLSDSEVLAQLDEALEGKEFIPYYQPVVDAQTGKIEMAEALVRWKSLKHGMMSPAVFIPVLERHGGLSRVDQVMEQHVFALQKQRVSAGQPVVPIDLNLSWVDFSDTKLVAQLQEHILDDSVHTDLVRFEITESVYDEVAETRMDLLSFFRENNVKLLVDDFGAGFSFGTMKHVEFHIAKIDKSLIDKIGESRKMEVIIEMLISVFHNLNAKVVAEGVELESQVEFLRRVGCDYIQGYYFYKPMEEEAFLQLLEEQIATAPVAEPVKLATTDQIVDESQQWVKRELFDQQNAKLQQSLEETKSLHLLLDAIDIHYFEWDVATHVDLASDKFCQMYGIPGNAIPNMPEEIPIVFEEDRPRFRTFYDRIANGEKMGSDCFRLYTPDGKGYTWYRKTFYTLFNAEGKPYKAVITMRDCQDEYRYRMLRERDRMLTQSQEIITFIYTLANDTISLNYLTSEGDVASVALENFLSTPEEQLIEEQRTVAAHLKQIIASGERSGYFDFIFTPTNSEYRAHYSMVDGEYGHLYAIIGQAEDINKTREYLEAKEQLLRLSEIDSLKQIRNRDSGEREMEKFIANGQTGVFAILDCDRFKSVNDSFGHAMGDELLRNIARLISEHNPHGVNMRLGGDEFAVFVPSNDVYDGLRAQVEHFFYEIDHLQLPGMEGFPVSLSIGAVLCDGQEKTDFDTLYRKADILLYKSKETPGNQLSL